MAAKESKLLAEIDENFLLCGICSERYENAKILPCLHSFCEPCLGKLALAEKSTTLTCPVCRRVHELADNAHAKIRLTKSHRLVSVEEYGVVKSVNPASVRPPVYSSTHPEYQIEFYCDTCDKVICLKCIALDHTKPDHLYRCVKDAAKEFTKTLHVVIDKVKKKETEVNNSKVLVQQIIESLDKCYQRVEVNIKKHICQTTEEITRLIQENGDKLLTELKGEYEKRKVILTAQLKEVDIAENDLTSTREYVEKLMHYGNASQLMSAKKGVDHQTEELLKVQTQVEPVEDDYMKFQPCNDFCRDKSLGTTKFVQTVYKLHAVSQYARVGEEIIVRCSRDVKEIISPPVKVEAVMTTPDGNTEKVEVKDNENGTMTLKTRVEVEGEHELSVTVCEKPVEGSPVNIKVIAKKGLVCKFGEQGSGIGQFNGLQGMTMMRNGDMLVAENYNERLQSFTVNGRHRKMFKFANISNFYPYDAAVSMNGGVFTTDNGNKQVIVCDENGELIRCFGKDRIRSPIGIAISPVNGRVYIVDNWAHCVHIYDQDGNHIESFGSEGSRKGRFRFPRFVCIDTIGNVYVSDSGNHRIQVFNGDGQFLNMFGYKGIGDGQFNNPQGVSLDKNGYVYVSDYKNIRILKFEPGGDFVCCDDNVSEGLCHATGLCVTDDNKAIVIVKIIASRGCDMEDSFVPLKLVETNSVPRAGQRYVQQ
ncbi:tripartite motif-containing protein 2-like [Ptychodera flava]|uniref:tripartite motif-containing protein 2-like n=1 Tax=Ptychodera flava TaxID=63121 RepID=UPI00396A5EE9